ncbi:hypothetical protein CYMTET_49790, partial [Cymbomonas tetramitiformis]
MPSYEAYLLGLALDTLGSSQKAAISFTASKDFAQAEHVLSRALAQVTENKEYSPTLIVAEAAHNLALIYKLSKKFNQLEPLFSICLKVEEKEFGSQHIAVALRLLELSSLHTTLGNWSVAQPLHERAQGILCRFYGPRCPVLPMLFTRHVAMLTLTEQSDGGVLRSQPGKRSMHGQMAELCG